VYQIYHEDHDEYHLHSTEVDMEFDKNSLLAFLDRAKAPVIYDGELYWSEEMRDALDT
jgi:hypothetical protein